MPNKKTDSENNQIKIVTCRGTNRHSGKQFAERNHPFSIDSSDSKNVE